MIRNHFEPPTGAPLSTSPPLVGRTIELDELDQLARDVENGRSRALVLSGDPGVGKSALLDHLVAGAGRCAVVRAAGIAAETDFAFSGLHQLCGPLLDHLDALPAPQRSALATTFGVTTGPVPDPFLLALSVLSLFAGAASRQPLLCVVDDAHWLDAASARVLGFVARRLADESVGLVFARRSSAPAPWLDGVPERSIDGLGDEDARTLLASTLPGPLDPLVRDRIVDETRGNPLAILELPRGLTPAELAGGFGLSFTGGLSGRIEEAFHRRIAHLDAGQRRLALIAAAEPLGDAELLWQAAARWGISPDSVDTTAFDGLLQIGERVTFRHPLVRSATYRAASPAERRVVHRALAEVTDSTTDADRRAWHLAQAAEGPDEAVALELERSADRARSRGGLAAAAAFLERAAALSPEPAARATRALAAAEAKQRGGAADGATDLLDLAESGPLDPLPRARVGLLRARAAAALQRNADVPPLLLQAAGQLEALDPRLARDTYLDALAAAQWAGRIAPGTVLAAAEAARRAPPPDVRQAHDDLLEGLSALIIDGYDTGVPLVRRAIGRFLTEELPGEYMLRWGWIAGRASCYVWDFEAWRTFAASTVQLARDTGALSTLPIALPLLLAQRALAGELEGAASLGAELEAATEATGTAPLHYGMLQHLAWQGRETEATAYIDAVERDCTTRGEGLAVTAALMARAILTNGLGRHDEAFTAATRGSEHPEDMVFYNWSLAELVEAAVRCRRHRVAVDALDRLAARSSASATDWSLGVESRCRALIASGSAAEEAYRDAIERLERTSVRAEAARAHLLYGEWLRRERRRLEARRALRRAHELFTDMGLEAFASRAARELAATGETARSRTVDTQRGLTPRELQIAQLAAEGLSNPEIGTRLFLSARTVEYHLRKVFTKLGISTRVQLSAALDRADAS